MPVPIRPPTGSPEDLRSSLHGRGQRLTPQRQRVLGLFNRLGEGRHRSAEDVHQRLLAVAISCRVIVSLADLLAALTARLGQGKPLLAAAPWRRG